MSTSPTRRTAVVSTMAVLTSLTLAATANAATFEWNVDADGNWNDQANWALVGDPTPGDDGVPGSGDQARLENNITADRTITVNSAVTVNNFRAGDASHTFILSGSGSITGQSTTSFILRNGGNVQFNVDWSPRDPAGFGDILGDGTILLNSTMNAQNGNVDMGSNSDTRPVLQINPTGFVGNIKWDRYLDVWGDLVVNKTGQLVDTTSFGVFIKQFGDFSAMGTQTVSDDFTIELQSNEEATRFLGGDLTIDGSTTFDSRNFDTTFKVSSGTLTLNGDVNWDSDSGANDRIIVDGTLEVSGSGNSYTSGGGDIDIDGTGTFLLNNADGSATGTGNTLEIASGITLGGDGGTESSVLVEGGTVAPGNSIGDLSLGTTTFQAGSTLDIEFSLTDSDTLIVDGDLDLSNVENLNLLGTADTNNTYTLVTYTGTLTGTFDNVDFGTTGFVLSDIDYGDGTNDAITLTGFVIPEPAAAGLVILGGLAMLGRRRRREA